MNNDICDGFRAPEARTSRIARVSGSDIHNCIGFQCPRASDRAPEPRTSIFAGFWSLRAWSIDYCDCICIGFQGHGASDRSPEPRASLFAMVFEPQSLEHRYCRVSRLPTQGPVPKMPTPQSTVSPGGVPAGLRPGPLGGFIDPLEGNIDICEGFRALKP